MFHDTLTPDVETASAEYSRRFQGPVGSYFLETQSAIVRSLLSSRAPSVLKVLEIGGGHGQLASLYVALRHDVVVQGSHPQALARLRETVVELDLPFRFVVSNLWELPFPDASFDLVVGLRLMAHVEHWRELMGEMARVSRSFLVIDYPALSSLNILTPLLFPFKRRIEKDTRPYFFYRNSQIRRHLRSLGYETTALERQFALPMGLHRMLGSAGVSRRLESFSRSVGLTPLIGSPCVLMAERGAERSA